MRLGTILILALTAAAPAHAFAGERAQAAGKADITVNEEGPERLATSGADQAGAAPEPAAAAQAPIGVNEPGVNLKDPATGGVGQAGDTYERAAGKAGSAPIGINEPGINLKTRGD